jgi:AmmeMemoRadiSam system protein A
MNDDQAFDINLDGQRKLLRIARDAIAYFIENRALMPYTPDPEEEELQLKSGAFVTLHKGEQLRGCIGYIVSEAPLYRTVIEAAVSAAFEDPRFPPVQAEELDGLEIEISVLSPPVDVKDLSEIVVGRDGLIVSDGFHRGLLLPQVATEYDWDREAFLSHTCLKAGLPAKAWRSGVSIQRFEAQVFNEAEFK